MDLQRVAVKFFASEGGSIPLHEFIPVFHAWIQGKRVGGIPIDVSDYSHVENGPGVVLIGHDADYFMDASEGPFGLLYNRKRGLEGSINDRWHTCFREALAACALLEEAFKGRLRFRANEALVILNDRLATPNEKSAFSSVGGLLGKATAEIFGGESKLTRRDDDPRSRLAVTVRGPKATDIAGLLSRLK